MVTGGGLDLPHLHPAAREIARLPAPERLRYARADRWIGYMRATEALSRLEALFTWPSRQRMPNLLLTGPTNNGKSMLIEKFRRNHPPVSGPDREEIPVLVVQMPPTRPSGGSTPCCWPRPGPRCGPGPPGSPTWSRSRSACSGWPVSGSW